jgi:hypothetical protein
MHPEPPPTILLLNAPLMFGAMSVSSYGLDDSRTMRAA